MAKKPTKAAKKSTKAKNTATPKATRTTGPGVIATIKLTIARPSGASAAEILEKLVKQFPDREPDGMLRTVRIQANKNAKKKDRDEKRGLVYFG